MRNLQTIGLIVSDVAAAATFFREVVGLPQEISNPNFAQFRSQGLTIMLSRSAEVPTGKAAGIILHILVDNVALALSEAESKGASVLQEITETDWWTESAMIAGPDGIVIDFYKPI